jgi:hypothetical protein
MKKTGPPIPQYQATGPSPETKQDAQGQESVEGNEAPYLKRRVHHIQDVGESAESEIEGGIRQNPHIAPDIRSGRNEEEKMKE